MRPTFAEIMARIAKDDAERARAVPLMCCPFCGDTARLVRCADSWSVWCDNLDCGGAGPSRPSARGAGAAWNKRKEPAHD